MKGFNDDAISEMPKEVVYFIGDGDAIKIGKTSGHPLDRLKGLQTGNPRELEVLLIAYANNLNATTLEQVFHSRYKMCSIRGEWFSTAVCTLLTTKCLQPKGYHIWEETYWDNRLFPTKITYLTGEYMEKSLKCGMDYKLYCEAQKAKRQYEEMIKKKYAELARQGRV